MVFYLAWYCPLRTTYLTHNILFKCDESYFVDGSLFLMGGRVGEGGVRGAGGGWIVCLGLFMLVLGFVICNMSKIRKTGQWSLALDDNWPLHTTDQGQWAIHRKKSKQMTVRGEWGCGTSRAIEKLQKEYVDISRVNQKISGLSRSVYRNAWFASFTHWPLI